MPIRLTHTIVVATMLLAFSPLVVAQDAQPANGNTGAAQQNGGGRGPRGEAKPSGPAPVRDLNGWWAGGEAQLNNRVPPMTAVGQAKLKENIPDPFSASSNDPWKTCDPFGMPRVVNNGYDGGGIGFAQMPDRIIVLHGYSRVWREVWMDGRPLPKNVGHTGGPSTTIYGYSIGHWEGDNTLVVDTIGIDDGTWMDRRGYPHSIDAHITERYTRVDHDHLNMTQSVDDPAYYTQPFVLAKETYTWTRGQDDPSVPIPFTGQNICIPSQMTQYLQLLAAPADEDSATGQKSSGGK